MWLFGRVVPAESPAGEASELTGDFWPSSTALGDQETWHPVDSSYDWYGPWDPEGLSDAADLFDGAPAEGAA